MEEEEEEGKGLTHNFNSRLAIVLHRQRERGLKPGTRLAEHEERLVRTFPLAVLLGRQRDLQAVGAIEHHGSREDGCLVVEPITANQPFQSTVPSPPLPRTYCLTSGSLVPAFFAATVTFASSKPQDEEAA